MGKREKEHRKKVQKRNEQLKNNQNRLRNTIERHMQIQKQINKEAESGVFDNAKPME